MNGEIMIIIHNKSNFLSLTKAYVNYISQVYKVLVSPD